MSDAVQKTLQARAYAKVNIGFAVTGVRGSMHTVDSVMRSVDIFDEVKILLRNDGMLNVACDKKIVGENSAKKAAEIFFEAFSDIKFSGLDIEIKKGIPFGAGLGGSSADAAAVLVMLSKMYGKAISVDVMLKLGSDTPFMCEGGAMRVKGIGEELEKLDLPDAKMLVVVPGLSVLSKDAYLKYDKIGGENADIDKLVAALKHDDFEGISRFLKNGLYKAAREISPDFADFADKTQEAVLPFSAKNEAALSMTGSGSGMLILCKNERTKTSLASEISKFAQVFDAGFVEKSIEIV